MVLLERGVGVEAEGGGGSGGLVREEGREGGREVGARLFTPGLLIPLLKGFCSIMPDSFRK